MFSYLVLAHRNHEKPNAGAKLPRTQRIKHPSLADESRAIRGQLERLVRTRPPRRSRRAHPLNSYFDEPLTAPADARCHASFAQWDAASCDDQAQRGMYHASCCKHYLEPRQPSIEARAADRATHKASGRRPNAGIERRRAEAHKQAEAKHHDKHAIPPSARMTCSTAR